MYKTSCSEKSKTFIFGNDIYLDYSASIEDPSITSTLTYPDKTQTQIKLPSSIHAEQIGTYILEASASKEGYKTANKKTMFAVIAEEPKIEARAVAVVSGGDDYYLIVAAAFIIIIFIIVAIFLKYK